MAMSLQIGRLLGSRSSCLLNAGYNLNRNALFTTSAHKCIQMKIVQPNQLDKLSYDEKNALLKRELSPHLTIYKPQLTTMLSISHRITGLALTGYALAFCVGAVLPPNDISYWVNVIESMQLSTPTVAFIKFYVALPVTYHTLNGIRHLTWDNGKNLKLEDVYKTGYIVIALSILSALGLSVY